MKTYKLTTLMFSLFILSSCEKSKNDVIGNNIEIVVHNQQGQNLLATPVTYAKSDINVYYFVNGQPQLYNQPNLAADKGFLLVKDDAGVNKIRIFTDYIKDHPTTLTLIKFGNSQTDTIKCKYRFEGSSVFLEKVWYNSVLKSREFTVIK